MGLDMYLYFRKYDSILRTDGKDIDGFYPPELDVFAREHFKISFLSKTTDYQIGYWRKANAIHEWIVNNCADGVDECQPIYLGCKKLSELHDCVCKVLDHPTKAKSLLPTSQGCFFGSQEYDDWYFDDLKYTKDLLERVLNFLEEHKDYLVVYEASW